MPVSFEHPQRRDAATLGTPPKTGRARDPDPPGCLNRTYAREDQLPVSGLDAEPSFTSTSPHDVHMKRLRFSAAPMRVAALG